MKLLPIAAQYFFWGIFKLFYCLKIYGNSRFPQSGAIIAPNHASFYDPPIISASAPGETHYLARKSLFHIPILNFFIKRLNAHPVEGTAQDAASLRLICTLLSQNKKVVIFPEGERTYDGSLMKIQNGIAMLAVRSGCPIIPTYIHGAFNVWPRQKKFPKPFGKVACVFGKPIDIAKFSSLNKKEAQAAITKQVSDSILSLRNWYLSGAKGNPP